MTRGDIGVLVLAVALIGTLYVHYWRAPVAATAVEIRSPDAPVQRYPLDQRRRIEVQGRIGLSVVEIRDGAVRFVDGPCRNRVCVHSGWLRHGGDTAGCLPNRVGIRLTGGGERLDAISY